MSKDYVSVQYDTSIRPITTYPEKLAKRLCDLNGIRPGAKLLEVGAGRPDVLKGFKNQHIEVFGCDISKTSKEQCEAEEIPLSLWILSRTDFHIKTTLLTLCIPKVSLNICLMYLIS